MAAAHRERTPGTDPERLAKLEPSPRADPRESRPSSASPRHSPRGPVSPAPDLTVRDGRVLSRFTEPFGRSRWRPGEPADGVGDDEWRARRCAPLRLARRGSPSRDRSYRAGRPPLRHAHVSSSHSIARRRRRSRRVRSPYSHALRSGPGVDGRLPAGHSLPPGEATQVRRLRWIRCRGAGTWPLLPSSRGPRRASGHVVGAALARNPPAALRRPLAGELS